MKSFVLRVIFVSCAIGPFWAQGAVVIGPEIRIPDQYMELAPQYKMNMDFISWHFRMTTFNVASYYPVECKKSTYDRLHLEFEVHNWSGASDANANEIHGAVMLRNNTVEVTPFNPTVPGRFENGWVPGPANGWSRDGTWIEPAWARVSTGVGVAFGNLMPSMESHIAVEMFNKQVPTVPSPLIAGSEGPWWTYIQWRPVVYRVHLSSFLSRNGSHIPGHPSSSVVAYAVDYKMDGGGWVSWVPIKFAYDNQIRGISPGAENSDAPDVYGMDISFSTVLRFNFIELPNAPIFKNIKAQWSCY